MTTTIDGVFVELTGSLARSGISAASFAELSDDQSENTHRAIARLSREVATYLALSAANVAARSDWQLGREGLARKKGYPSPEDYVQSLGGGGGGTKADTRRLIEAGTMATEAQTALDRQKQADRVALEFPERPAVDVHVPWFAPLGTAVTDGTLGTESATAIRRGLGEPAIGVTEASAPAPGQIVRTAFIEGTPDAVPTTTINRSICNGGFIPVLFSRDGTTLDVGREQRPVVEPVETHSGTTRGPRLSLIHISE